MKKLIEKYGTRLKCLFGRHQFQVIDSLMAKMTDIHCTRPGCKFHQIVPVKAEDGIATAVDLHFIEGKGIILDIYRTDIDRKVLSLVYGRNAAIKQGQQFLSLANKIATRFTPSKEVKNIEN